MSSQSLSLLPCTKTHQEAQTRVQTQTSAHSTVDSTNTKVALQQPHIAVQIALAYNRLTLHPCHRLSSGPSHVTSVISDGTSAGVSVSQTMVRVPLVVLTLPLVLWGKNGMQYMQRSRLVLRVTAVVVFYCTVCNHFNRKLIFTRFSHR